MKKLINCCIILILLMISSITYASILGDKNSVILADMYKNTSHYVHIGSDNFGLSFYLDKTTVNVHEYSPPNYIIAFRTVYHVFTENLKNTIEEFSGYTNDGIKRYKYDYSKRNMYVERYDSNGNPYWEYLAPLTEEQKRKWSGGAIRGREREIAQGEIAFFLSYGISFYQQPATEVSEKFINKNFSRMIPLIKLHLSSTNDGKTHTSHEYNHKTNQIEVWQYTYNKATQKFDSRRIK